MTTLAGSAIETSSRTPWGDIRLRPAQQASGRRVITAVLALLVPAFGTAFAIAITSAGDTRLLCAATVVAAVLVLVLAIRFSRTGVVLHAHGFTEHGIATPPRFVANERIASASIVQVYDPQTLQTRSQLFLLDAAGATLLRLRGRFWSNEQIEVVARHVGGPVDTVAEPLTLAELRRGRRAQLSWYERHPLLSMVALTGVGLLVALGIALTVTAAMPPLPSR